MLLQMGCSFLKQLPGTPDELAWTAAVLLQRVVNVLLQDGSTISTVPLRLGKYNKSTSKWMPKVLKILMVYPGSMAP